MEIQILLMMYTGNYISLWSKVKFDGNVHDAQGDDGNENTEYMSA